MPVSELGSRFFYNLPGNILHNGYEEHNVTVLREHGFTVPEHQVFGVVLEEGVVKVNLGKEGWTITEDLSEGGVYQVSDIMPIILLL